MDLSMSNSVSGQQIEDLGEFLLHTNVGDHLQVIPLGYGDDDEEEEDGTSAPSLQQMHTSIQQQFALSTGTAAEMAYANASAESLALLSAGALYRSDSDINMGAVSTLGSAPGYGVGAKSPFRTPRKSGSSFHHAPKGGGRHSERSSATSPTTPCQPISFGAREQQSSASEGAESTAERLFEDSESSCTADTCSPITRQQQPDESRGFRKKSREKMRRHEVNTQFDELVSMLGLSNRVNKSAILHEAVVAIKALKRDRDDSRRERDRLQHEVNSLMTYLQYTHPAVAAGFLMHHAPGGAFQDLGGVGGASPLVATPQGYATSLGSPFANLPPASAASTRESPPLSRPPSFRKVAIAPKKPDAPSPS